MTSLPLTLSWMPHCWPQKQQCVFTSRSGSADVESRSPAMYERGGPNRRMMPTSSVGIVATSASLRLLRGLRAPERRLREPEERPPALRADLLVVLPAFHLVAEPELL